MATSTDDLEPLAVLAEPIRRRLYDFVVGASAPVDRDAAAEGVGIARPLAAFHLDRLAAAGLLDVTYHRRSGRTGPGAGRPAKFYLRPVSREFGVSLPPRAYDLAAEILAEGVERRPDATAAVLAAARARGEQLAAGLKETSTGPDALLGLLAEQGYEPYREHDGAIGLRNCPFHALVDRHRALTCSMNLAMLQAVSTLAEGTGLVAQARPRDGSCCVAFVPVDA
jgi:predicted ArsR family transcriptional regulator